MIFIGKAINICKTTSRANQTRLSKILPIQNNGANRKKDPKVQTVKNQKHEKMYLPSSSPQEQQNQVTAFYL